MDSGIFDMYNMYTVAHKHTHTHTHIYIYIYIYIYAQDNNFTLKIGQALYILVEIAARLKQALQNIE